MPSIERLTTPAFAFDIDGVLVKGRVPVPGAREAILLLQQLDIPFIFLTNGGGLTEEAHVERLASRLGLTLDPRQFVQSHTPYHDLVPRYRDRAVLVLGGAGDQIRDVAHAYGFRNVLTSSDFYADMPSIHPFPEMTHDHHVKFGRPASRTALALPTPPDSDAGSGYDDEDESLAPRDTPVAAIMIWSSPRDWMLDLQLTLDLLLSTDGTLSSPRRLTGGATATSTSNTTSNDVDPSPFPPDATAQPMLYICNPDFQWATNAPAPRLAQGAFVEALRGIWAKATGGADLPYQACGKPTERTFEYGEAALHRWNSREPDQAAHLKQLHAADDDDAVPVPATAPAATATGPPPPKPPRRPREISTVYMVGDNPESDIAGANAYVSRLGYAWKSVLVSTGVHVPGTTPAHVPSRFCADVLEAVTEILAEEALLC